MRGSMFEVGTTVADTYRIEREIGRGGMGVVLLCEHLRLPGKKVALKAIDTRIASDDVIARFKREAHIVSLLAHPNIVHIEDYNVTEDGTPYLILEYLQGESLAQRLARGPLNPEDTITVATQVAAALTAAHERGVVHRDLKPHNIFLCSNGTVKVLDFGISKMRDADTIRTAEDQLLGTPQYMSPEQATGNFELVDARSDVFSLGATVYEMLAGKPAFTGDNVPSLLYKIVHEPPPSLPGTVPPRLAQAIRQAMAKRPAERFANVHDLIAAMTDENQPASVAFDATVDSAPVPKVSSDIARSSDLANTRDPSRRRKAPVVWIALGLATFAAAGTLFLLLHGAPRNGGDPSHGLDPTRMRLIGAQLLVRPEVQLDGHRYTVEQVGGHHLHRVKFEIAGRGFEAIEQNADKDSRWAKLAREGHVVIQFRDLETKRYVGVLVDGRVQRDTSPVDADE